MRKTGNILKTLLIVLLALCLLSLVVYFAFFRQGRVENVNEKNIAPRER